MRRPASVLSVLAIPVLGGHLFGCFPDPKLLDALDTSVSVEDAQPPADVTPTHDGLACTGDGECSALAGPCVTATCENGICETAELDDVPCDDGLACTTDDLCTAGSCVGQVRVCEAPGQCEQAGACDPSSGECVYPRATNGTSCDDGDRCTAGDACLDGVCRSTRTPDDSLGDWVQLFTGTTSAQLAGIEIDTSGIAVLVSFQVDALGSRTLGLGGSNEVSIPSGSIEAVALFVLRLDGRPASALLVAHGQGTVRAERLDALSDGRLLISGLGSGLVERSGGEPLDLGMGSMPQMFSLTVSEGQVDPEFWIATPSAQQGGGVTAFVASGTDCIAVIPVANDVEATLSNGRGVVASMTGVEGAFAGAWFVWLPGCGSLVGVQRYLRTSTDGGLLVSAVDSDQGGDVVIAGASTAGLALGPPGAETPELLPSAGNHSFVLRLDAGREVTLSETLKDSATGSLPVPWTAKATPTRTAYSIDVTGVASVERSTASPAPIPGNPMNDVDRRPRAVIRSLSAAAADDWLEILAFFDYDAKTGSAAGALDISSSGRLLTVSSHRGRESLSEAADDIHRVRAFSPTGSLVWDTPFLVPVAAFSTVGPSYVRAVPASESVILGGSVSGVGKVLNYDIDTGPDESAVRLWLARLNSDDGVGCGR